MNSQIENILIIAGLGLDTIKEELSIHGYNVHQCSLNHVYTMDTPEPLDYDYVLFDLNEIRLLNKTYYSMHDIDIMDVLGEFLYANFFFFNAKGFINQRASPRVTFFNEDLDVYNVMEVTDFLRKGKALTESA